MMLFHFTKTFTNPLTPEILLYRNTVEAKGVPGLGNTVLQDIWMLGDLEMEERTDVENSFLKHTTQRSQYTSKEI